MTSSRFCLYLLNIYHSTYTFSHAHTEAHTHKHTCTISTQEEWRQPGTGAWLKEAWERLCYRPYNNNNKKREKNVQKKTIFTNLKKRFEHIELPAKLLNRNKSNINQFAFYISKGRAGRSITFLRALWFHFAVTCMKSTVHVPYAWCLILSYSVLSQARTHYFK